MIEEQKQPPTSPDRGELVRELNRVSREASALGVLFGETVAKHLGINHTDLECLDLIFVRKRVTAGEIAEVSGLTTGAVTGVIDRLERVGLARRERDKVDRRKVYVKATPKVTKIARTYYGSFERNMNRLTESYTDEQIALLVEFYSRSGEIIRGELKKLGDEQHATVSGSRRPKPERVKS